MVLQGKMPCLRFNDLDSIFFGLSDSQIYLLIKSSRPKYGWVQQVWSVGGSYDKYLMQRRNIHLLQKLRDYSVHDLIGVSTISAFWDQRIKLIHEDYTWTASPRSFEDRSHILFALAYIHIQQLRSFHADEIHFAFFCHAFPQQSFTGSWRAVEKQSCSWFDPLIEYLRVSNWKQYSLYDLFFCSLKTSNIIPVYFNQILYFLLFNHLTYCFHYLLFRISFYLMPIILQKGMQFYPAKFIIILIDNILFQCGL